MFKKLFVLFVPLVLSSCAWLFGSYEEEYRICPLIDIAEQSLIQRTGPDGEFKLEIVGVEGFCYVDEKTGFNKAVLNPVVRVTRLPGAEDTDVHFAFYTETLQGPPRFLGKKVFYTNAIIPEDSNEIIFRPKQVEREIPHDMVAEYDMKIGFIISPNEKKNLLRSKR